MTLKNKLIFIWISFYALYLTALSAGAAQLLKQGDPAPEFAIEDANGKMFRLADYQGQIVIMGFIRKAENKAEGEKWMAENRRWLVELDKLFADKAVIAGVIGIDPPFYLKPFAKQKMKNAPFHALADWDGEVVKKYPSDSLFNLYVVDKAGRIECIISEAFSTDKLKKLSTHIKNLINLEKQL